MEQTTPNGKSAEMLFDQLKLLYSSCVTEIAGFKEQQWKITNYALLVYAAIVSIAKTTASLRDIEWFVLFVAAVSVFVFSTFIIKSLADSIHIRRTRLTEVRKHFAKEFMVAWGGGKPENEIHDDPNKKPRLDWFFYSILTLGFAATVWQLARQLTCTC